jgi:DNA-binding NtrC family response regulator
MPRMSGGEVLELIKSWEKTVEIIMICGFAKQDTVAGFLERGAVGFLHKPLDLNALLAALNVALAIRADKK